MKKIISILVALIMCFILTSCVTYAQAQVDDIYDDNVDISLVVSYGTPYYNAEGLLLYYIYRDMFYYPYYYHNRYYLHRYSRPLSTERMRMYRPVPRDFYHNTRPPKRHNGITHPSHNGRGGYDARPSTRPNQPRPNMNRLSGNINRGSNRPMMQPRSSTRTTVGVNHSRSGMPRGGRR